MKTVFFILILVHGSIYTLGFLKAFEIKEFKELMLSISKGMGIAWPGF